MRKRHKRCLLPSKKGNERKGVALAGAKCYWRIWIDTRSPSLLAGQSPSFLPSPYLLRTHSIAARRSVSSSLPSSFLFFSPSLSLSLLIYSDRKRKLFARSLARSEKKKTKILLETTPKAKRKRKSARKGDINGCHSSTQKDARTRHQNCSIKSTLIFLNRSCNDIQLAQIEKRKTVLKTLGSGQLYCVICAPSNRCRQGQNAVRSLARYPAVSIFPTDHMPPLSPNAPVANASARVRMVASDSRI